MRATLNISLFCWALLCCAIAPAMAQSRSGHQLLVAGTELLAVRVTAEGTTTESPRQSLGGTCNELLAIGSGRAVAAHARGLTVVTLGAGPKQAPLLRVIAAGREIDAVEALANGRLLALEHPREVQGEAVEPHAVLRLQADGSDLDTLGLLSPAAYDFRHDARAARIWVSHLSGRTIESLIEANDTWTVASPLRLDAASITPLATGAARIGSEPKDDAFWLDRLLFPSPDGGTLLVSQGRDVAPRLLELEGDRPRERHAWSTVFLARNGATSPDGSRLWLNAGRRLFGLIRESGDGSATTRYREREEAIDGTVVALAFSPDGATLALLIAESREVTRLELHAPDLTQRVASLRLRGAFTQVSFVE